MDLLGITSLRPGRDGRNTNSPNYANYDEAKANPYPDLPNPLVLKNGRKVTTPKIWWQKRRPEIVEGFDREVYGRVPAVMPKVTWEIAETNHETNGPYWVNTKRLIGHVDHSACPEIHVDIVLTLATPADATGPVPVITQFGFAPPPSRGLGTNVPAGAANRPPRGNFAGFNRWQQEVLAEGWGYATIVPNSVQADTGSGLTRGIIGLVNKGQPRKADDWGALRAQGVGREPRAGLLPETDPAVDFKRVGREGHSRYRKATLVAMAYDPRFAIRLRQFVRRGRREIERRDCGEIVEGT